MVLQLKEKDFDVLVAENRFVNDILFAIETALHESDASQADLARALGISEARVSQILAGNGKNLQARTIARIAHVLGLRPEIDFVDPSVSEEAKEGNTCRLIEARFKEWAIDKKSALGPAWEGPSNDDEAIEITSQFPIVADWTKWKKAA